MNEKKISTTIKVCEKCGEPLEQLFNGPILGMDRHPRMCQCMRIADGEERMRRAQREQEEMISRNRSSVFQTRQCMTGILEMMIIQFQRWNWQEVMFNVLKLCWKRTSDIFFGDELVQVQPT